MKRHHCIYFVIFIFLLISSAAKAQLLLAKRMFYLTLEYNPQQQGFIKYIDYVNGSTYTIDSNLYNDMSMYEDKLVASGSVLNIYQVPGMASQGMTLYWTVTLNALKAVYDPLWKGALIYAVDTPFLRRPSYYGILVTLDTSLVPYGIVDMLIYNDAAYLLYQDHLRIIRLDPLSLDTVLQTPMPFPFGGYNQWLIQFEDQLGNNHIYIDIEYATGAPRSSLIELDLVSMTFDTVFHKLGLMNYYRPVVADGMIFMMNFNTRYDPVADSLYISTFPFHPFIYTAGYCEIDNSYYLYNTITKTVYEADFNGIISDSVVLNEDVKRFGLWCDVMGSSDNDITVDNNVFIYPLQGSLEIRAENLFVEDISIFDLSGRLVMNKNISQNITSFSFPFNKKGIFIVSIKTDSGVISKKVLVQFSNN